MASALARRGTAQRLAVLQLAESLGSVSQACRLYGVSRTQFYQYRRRLEREGPQGLDHVGRRSPHPQTTPLSVARRLVAISLQHPTWGCDRVAAYWRTTGSRISAPTIQEILNKNGVGTRGGRARLLEQRAITGLLTLSEEQQAAVEQENPCFREFSDAVTRPGELICQDTLFLGVFPRFGRLHLQVAVDTYSSYAFALLHVETRPEYSAVLLARDVVPFYSQRRIPINTVLTDGGGEYWAMDGHPDTHHYERYLAYSQIEHRRGSVRRRQPNGFVRYFLGAALEEFFRAARSTGQHTSLDDLQESFEVWLRYYNTQRSHPGYPNQGVAPIDTTNAYLVGAKRERRAQNPAKRRSSAWHDMVSVWAGIPVAQAL